MPNVSTALERLGDGSLMHWQHEDTVSASGQIALLVRGRDEVSEGVVLLSLVDPDEAPLPPWTPGSHLGLRLPGLVRHYSLCGQLANPFEYRIAVLREPRGRGGSQLLHDSVRVGDTIAARRPSNRFPLQGATSYLFIAGGIGITPFLPMIAQLQLEDRSWRLVYGGRTRASMAFIQELSEYGSRVSFAPQDEVGLLDLDAILADAGDADVYYCGPEPLLSAIEQRCVGWDPGRLHTERFAAPRDLQRMPRDFTVFCAQTGKSVAVPADISMLDALLAAGVDMAYDCKEGTCGTCELELIDGEADHRDAILAPSERPTAEIIFPCVSRALGERLVVDA